MGSEITRSLASIQRISDIRPIPGADNIEVATVLGWDVVVKKGEFEYGEYAVYFEIDSFLPRRPEWAFLEKSCLRKMGDLEGLRLRTIKLRGQVSQGLLLPLTILDSFEVKSVNYHEGMDLTTTLGVVKWDPPVPANLAGVARGNFPSFLQKTDQERVQNCFGKLQHKWIEHKWEVSTKLDGSSATFYYNNGQFGVCSRNLDLARSEENSFWQLAIKYDLEKKMSEYGRNIAIQGELMGPGAQGNPEKLSELELFVFDVFDIDTQKYLDHYERMDIVDDLLLKHTPILDLGLSLEGVSLQEILSMAEGPSYNPNVEREGIVFKSLTNPSVSFKAISNKFLLGERD